MLPHSRETIINIMARAIAAADGGALTADRDRCHPYLFSVDRQLKKSVKVQLELMDKGETI